MAAKVDGVNRIAGMSNCWARLLKKCEQYTVHNKTFPAFAHSSTRDHAFTDFLAWLKIEPRLTPSRFNFAP